MATTLFQETPVALAGEFIQKGVQAPDFSLVKGDLSTFSLADAKGKFVVLNIFPSMDTGVSARQKESNTLFLCLTSAILPLSEKTTEC